MSSPMPGMPIPPEYGASEAVRYFVTREELDYIYEEALKELKKLNRI